MGVTPPPTEPDEDLFERGREDVRVHIWRRREFRRMGFSRYSARMMDECGCDLHEAANLLGAGCSLQTAEAILL